MPRKWKIHFQPNENKREYACGETRIEASRSLNLDEVTCSDCLNVARNIKNPEQWNKLFPGK